MIGENIDMHRTRKRFNSVPDILTFYGPFQTIEENICSACEFF